MIAYISIESVANVVLMEVFIPNYILSCEKTNEDVTNHKSSINVSIFNVTFNDMFFAVVVYYYIETSVN